MKFLKKSHAIKGLFPETDFTLSGLETYDRIAGYETEYRFYFNFKTNRGYALRFPTFIRPITVAAVMNNKENKEISDNLLGAAHITLFDYIVSCAGYNTDDLMRLEGIERRADLAPMIAAVMGKDAAHAIIRYIDFI